MQDNNTTLSLEPMVTPDGTTAAGRETWLSDTGSESAIATGPEESAPTSAAGEIIAEIETGPANAADALALDTIANARKLTGPDGAELVVDPERGNYYFESTALKPLAALLQQPVDKWIPVYSEALNAVREASSSQPLERLRWYAGLVATPGILTRQLHSGGRYKLARWPETEREFPRHFRIAKAMMYEPLAAEEIAAISGTCLEEVTDYINASHASNRLETRPADKVPAASNATVTAGSRRGRLMARLNKPLFAR